MPQIPRKRPPISNDLLARAARAESLFSDRDDGDERDDFVPRRDRDHEPRDQQNSRVVALLNQIGDRLIRSEKDRLSLKGRIDDYEAILARIEREQKAHAEKLKRADDLTRRIEEALAQQGRINRRIEKITEDKTRMIRKLERIEETVLQTREALESKALVLLTDQNRAAKTDAPRLPATPLEDQKKKAEGGVWARPWLLQSAGVGALVLIAVFAGWAVTRLPVSLPGLPENPGSFSAQDAPAQPAAHNEAPDAEKSLAQAEDIPDDVNNPFAAQPAVTPAPSPALDPVNMDAESLEKAFAENPDALAAALNDIEPGINPVPEKIAQASTPPQDSAIAKPVAFTPPPKVAEETAAKEATAAAQKTLDSRETESFIAAQKDKTPLAQRIKPDASLPPVIKEIEKKAFEGMPEAQHDLAAIYTAGHAGVAVDYARAAQWFRAAAVQGVANARYNLGVLYHQGLGVDKDPAQAISWYRAAAQLGHPEAKYNLGIAHIEGIGTGYDPQSAARYFEEAANEGIVEAAYNLGLIHENGLLGSPDQKLALYWYKRAADRGNPEAQTALDQLAKAMKLSQKDIDVFIGDTVREKTPKKPVPEKKAQSVPPAAPVAVASPVVEAEAPPSPYPKIRLSDAEPAQKSTRDPAIVAQIQEQLMRLGLFPGPADGILTPQTEDSIRSYQTANKLSATGEASEALLVNLLTSELETTAATAVPEGLNESDMIPPGEMGGR